MLGKNLLTNIVLPIRVHKMNRNSWAFLFSTTRNISDNVRNFRLVSFSSRWFGNPFVLMGRASFLYYILLSRRHGERTRFVRRERSLIRTRARRQ